MIAAKFSGTVQIATILVDRNGQIDGVAGLVTKEKCVGID